MPPGRRPARTSAEEPEELARRAPDLALGTEKPKEYAD
jgi:hypothetical protein